MILKGPLASQPIAESLTVGLSEEDLMAQELRDEGNVVSGHLGSEADKVWKIDREIRFGELWMQRYPFLRRWKGQKIPYQSKGRVTQDEYIFESTTEREQLSLLKFIPGGHPRYELNPAVFQGRDYMTKAKVIMCRHVAGGPVACVEVESLRRIADQIYQSNFALCTFHEERWIEPSEYQGKVKMHRRWDARDHYWKTLLYIQKSFIF